jgi:hypothetical protein
MDAKQEARSKIVKDEKLRLADIYMQENSDEVAAAKLNAENQVRANHNLGLDADVEPYAEEIKLAFVESLQ